MPKIKINDVNIYYESIGAGTPLVLVAGVGCDHLSWMDSQIPTLIAAGYRCLVFDNRDVGQTEASAATASTIRQFAVDAAGLITQLAFGPAHILGASMGGMIVQELALQYPELVRSLTLVCSTGETDALLRELVISWQTARSQFSTSEFYQAFALWLFTHRFYDAPEAMQSFKQKLAANPFPQSVASFQRQCDAVLSFSALDRLSAITAPTHIIVGAEDILTAPRHSQALARQIAGSKLTMLPDCGHALFWERPAEFNQAVINFCKNY